jgi:hypothetical protein
MHRAVSGRDVLFLAWPQFDPLELAFWQRLRDALAERGLRLVLASTTPPPADLGVVHVPAVPSIDAVWTEGVSAFSVPVDTLGVDEAMLLAREAQWGAPAVLPAIETYRRSAMAATTGYWLETLAALNPAVVALWNGQHVSEIILGAAARQGGLPVVHVERAPIPQALFVDEQGLSSASSVAGLPSWPRPQKPWIDRAVLVSRRIAAGEHTWWQQPPSRSMDAAALRTQLGIPTNSLILLFAGQVDQDTQQFLFSPRFGSNAAAFEWLLGQLRGRTDVFVLGKQHPKSSTPAGEYQRLIAESGVPGTWRVDLSIDDALASANRVAAVNSTVLYEALARGLPVLSFGDWLLSRRQVAYEVHEPERDADVVHAWIDASDASARQRSWQEGLAFLLSTCLYTYQPDDTNDGLHGAAELAARFDRLANRTHHWRMPAVVVDAWLSARRRGTPPWRLPNDLREPNPAPDWQRAHTLRFQLLEADRAARAGRRVVIWGTGAGGRQVAALLDRSGVDVWGFVASTPDGPRAHGRPLVSPTGLMTGDFVIVASTAAPDIVPVLTARGFASAADFVVVDCDYLSTVSSSVTSPGGLSPSNP